MTRCSKQRSKAMPGLKDGGFLMTNFVDFDMLFGHRRDPVAMARRWRPSISACPRRWR